MAQLQTLQHPPISTEDASYRKRVLGTDMAYVGGRTWPGQDIVTIEGCHFPQEEAPEAMAHAIARFVAKVLASPPLSN